MTIFSTFKRWFTPPIFEDEIKTQQAYLLHVILWTLICIPIPFAIYTLIKTPENISRTFAQAAFGELVNIILLIMLRYGRVRLASIIQVSMFWLFFTWTAMTGMGVQGEAYMMGYALVIAIAGILLGGTGALTFTVLSLIMGGFMVYAETQGWLSSKNQSVPLTTWIVSLVLFVVGATLQFLNTRTVRNALARARESEERYRLISDVSTDYSFASEIDERGNANTTWVAGAFKRMTGYTFEEYMAEGGWIAHVHPDDREKDAHDMELLRKNKDVRSEIRTYAKNGDLRWERIFAHPIWDKKGNRLLRIVGAVQDVTEQKQVEADREALITELEAKNAELERFTYTVSHDLKSPLVTITGFLGYLENDAREGNIENVRASIGRISNAARKMHKLLNDLLELSRIGRLANPPEDIPFEDIIREALEQVRGRFEANQVRVEVHARLPIIRGDRLRLVEVAQNLLDNAAKFSRENSNPQIKIGCLGMDNDKNIILFVRDNGIGIAPQYHENIFGLFNKLNADTEGTGIGLALVKRIIEVHGGRIWVESEVGQGTTFYFTLPLSNP